MIDYENMLMTVIIDGQPAVRSIAGVQPYDFAPGHRGPMLPTPVLYDGEEVLWVVGKNEPIIVRTK